ncbi:MAG: response regulator transcription factor [Pseudomonadota bacterium]
MRIAVIEDNAALRKGITYRLSDDGHAVDALEDGQAADLFLRQEHSDLVILDINLPGLSGLEVLRNLRQRGDARPVILLTARAKTEDRVEGLDSGADDYLVKPFAMDELAARVRALARRKSAAIRRQIDVGPLTLDLEGPELSADGAPLDIPRRELLLFAALAEVEGRPVSKPALLDQIYGAGSETDEKVLEVYVSRLRKRLAKFGVGIRVRRGIGYALIVEPA